MPAEKLVKDRISSLFVTAEGSSFPPASLMATPVKGYHIVRAHGAPTACFAFQKAYMDGLSTAARQKGRSRESSHHRGRHLGDLKHLSTQMVCSSVVSLLDHIYIKQTDFDRLKTQKAF